MDDQPWHTSSTLSPSESSSPRSRSRALSWRSVIGGTTLVAIAVAVELLLFRPGAWVELVSVLAIPAVSISLSYFGGASIHTAIAYTTIRQEATRSRSDYLRLIRTEILPPAIAELKRDLRAEIRAIRIPELPPFPTIPPFPEIPDYGPIIAEIETKIAAVEGKIGAIQIPDLKAQLDAMPRPDLAVDLQEFLQSEDGRAWTYTLAESAGQQAANVLTARMTSKAGAVARTAQSKLYRILEGQINFGNPILDGAWALSPPEVRRAFINGLSRILRQAGVIIPDELNEIQDGELVQDGDARSPLALEDPEAIEWPPRY